MEEVELNLLEQIVTEIETNLPENVFQQYLYYKGLVDMYSEIVKYLNKNMENILSDVIDNNVKDDNFEVIYPAKVVRKVNIAKLNEQYPEVYDSLAFVETNKVLKLVDRSTIRKFILSTNVGFVIFSTLSSNFLSIVIFPFFLVYFFIMFFTFLATFFENDGFSFCF